MRIRLLKGLYQAEAGRRIYCEGECVNVPLRTALRLVREGLAERASKPRKKPAGADPESDPGTESAAA